MNQTHGDERELREILIAANSGEASAEQLRRLDELVRSDQRLAKYCAQLLDQQAAPSTRRCDGACRPSAPRGPFLRAHCEGTSPSDNDTPGELRQQDPAFRNLF